MYISVRFSSLAMAGCWICSASASIFCESPRARRSSASGISASIFCVMASASARSSGGIFATSSENFLAIATRQETFVLPPSVCPTRHRIHRCIRHPSSCPKYSPCLAFHQWNFRCQCKLYPRVCRYRDYVILREVAGSMQRLDCIDYASLRAAMTNQRGGMQERTKNALIPLRGGVARSAGVVQVTKDDEPQKEGSCPAWTGVCVRALGCLGSLLSYTRMEANVCVNESGRAIYRVRLSQ